MKQTKDRTYAELDELYQSGLPVRKFASVKLGGASREGIVAAGWWSASIVCKSATQRVSVLGKYMRT